jgi:hypothetical protein
MKREKQAKLKAIKLKKDATWSHEKTNKSLQNRAELI